MAKLVGSIHFRALLLLALCGWAGANILAEDSPAPAVRTRAQATLNGAEARYRAEPHNAEAAWQLGRAAFDFAEVATNKAERAEIAQVGIAACRAAVAESSNSAPAHYYLAMNLGQLARTKGLGALRLVNQMRHEFDLAREFDEHLDYAGPDRNLGQLYRDAPAFGSIGNRAQAQQHLQRAVQLAPDYPDNRLALIEAYVKWGERTAAQRELKALEEIWPRARQKLTGPAWAADWADWEAQLQKFKSKIESGHKPLEAPRH